MLYPSATRSDVTRLIKMAQDPQHRAHIDFSMQRKREIEAMFLSIDGNENNSGAIREADFLRGLQALGEPGVWAGYAVLVCGSVRSRLVERSAGSGPQGHAGTG